MARVGGPAPELLLTATLGSPSSRRRVTLREYRGRWLVLVFYPGDFSLLCPTELTAFSEQLEDFRDRDCEILGISTDPVETHERWIATPASEGGLGEIGFPLASDPGGVVSDSYGVYREDRHAALRGLFIVDPDGAVQYQAVNSLSVGRDPEEILRILAALKTGGMCPGDWERGAPTVDATDILGPGRKISGFRIETKIGSGSFATVYRAQDTLLDRHVALKVFKPDALPCREEVLSEARSAAALNHPHVCTIYGVDATEAGPVIAMEYVDGPTLRAMIQDGMHPREASRMGRQVARAMAAAHGAGVIHGDLKPSNILMSRSRDAKVVDFGVARRIGERTASPGVRGEEGRGGVHDTTVILRTATGARTISGTPCYMSPEQSRGRPLTPASDVFSLGIVLYEMLTGRRALKGSTVAEVLANVPRVDPSGLAAAVPEPFATVLEAALVPDPERREIGMDDIDELLSAPLPSSERRGARNSG